MKMILDDSELVELRIEDIINKSNDFGSVIIKGENVGKRNEGKSDLQKEIIANDALVIGPSKASEINGVPISSASKYKDGKDIEDDDTRSRINARRFNIADTAVAKLMETLDLFEPGDITKPNDIIKAASQLASIVERVTESGKSSGNQVILHLYGPKQKSMESYLTIDV